MRSVVAPVVAIASLALLTACGGGDNPVKPELKSQFTASVSGSVNKSMNGDAAFVVTPTIVTIALVNSGSDGSFIQLSRTGLPGVGTYAIKGDKAQGGDFVALFGGGGANNFVATSGSITITESTADRISGTFSFTGTGVISAAATVTISGKFDAKRGSTT